MSNPNNKPGSQNQKPQSQQNQGENDQRQQQQEGGGHNPAEHRGGPSRDRQADTKRPGAGKK